MKGESPSRDSDCTHNDRDGGNAQGEDHPIVGGGRMTEVIPGARARRAERPERPESPQREPESVATDDIALFRAYPYLREVVARRPFVGAPSPIESLSMEGLPDGRCDQRFIEPRSTTITS